MKIFEDLLISYRGAGVIGTCVAVFVLLSCIGLSLFALDPSLNGMSESGAAVTARQEREIARLRAELEAEESKLAGHRDARRFQDQVGTHEARARTAEKRLEELADKIGEATAALDEVRRHREDYAADYREQVRRRAAGEKLPAVVTRDGRRLESPVVVKVDPAGIQFRHRDGMVRIPAEDLPPDLHERFQFDKAEMERFRASEQELAAKHDEHVEAGLAEAKEAGEDARQARIGKLEGRVTFLKERVAAASRQYAQLRRDQRRHYHTLVALIRQVERDEQAIRRCLAELEKLKDAEE